MVAGRTTSLFGVRSHDHQRTSRQATVCEAVDVAAHTVEQILVGQRHHRVVGVVRECERLRWWLDIDAFDTERAIVFFDDTNLPLEILNTRPYVVQRLRRDRCWVQTPSTDRLQRL